VYVGDLGVQDETAFRLPSEAGHHVARVMRARSGDTLDVFDARGREARAVIVSIHRDSVDVTVDAHGWRAGVGADPSRVTLLQGVPKGEKLEAIVRQATELGVAAIRPVFTARAIPRPGGATTRVDRLRAIAISACEQCQRAVPPAIEEAASLESAFATLDASIALRIVAWEDGGDPFLEAVGRAAPGACAVLVGPEGGFEPREIELARSHGFVAVTLGPRILRTETVAPAILAAISVVRGDLAATRR
jgi:16S rRNA (uracil1498-N3)-methyltransferase